jgi:hypothetical protein
VEAERWLLGGPLVLVAHGISRLDSINDIRGTEGQAPLDLVTAAIMISKLDEDGLRELRNYG